MSEHENCGRALKRGSSTATFFVVQKLNRATSAEELLQAENEIYTLLLLEQRNAYSDATSVIQVVEFTNSGEPQFGSLGGMEMLTEGV
jgi:hypothetical protein